MLPIAIIVIVGLFGSMIPMMIYQQKFFAGEITKEEMLNVLNQVTIAIGIIMSIPFIVAIGSSFKIYIEVLKFQAEQAGLDTFEITMIKNPKDKNKYQAQTPPGSNNDIKIIERMLDKIKSTRAYQSLLSFANGGNSLLDIDRTDLFKQMDEDIKEMSKNNIDKDLKELKRVITQLEDARNKGQDMDKVNTKIEDEDELDDEDLETEDETLIEEDELNEDETINEEGEPNEDGNSRPPPQFIPPESLPDKANEQPLENKDPANDDKLQKVIASLKKGIKTIVPKIKNLKEKLKFKIITGADDNSESVSFNYNLLTKIALLQNAKESHWTMGYRTVRTMKCLDRYVPINSSDKDISDPLENIVGFYYIIPDEEKNIFDFNEAISSDESQVKVRKCYVVFKLIEWIVPNKIPLFLCENSALDAMVYNLQMSGKTFGDAETIALANLTYMSYENESNLYKQISALEAIAQTKQTAIDSMVNEKLEALLDKTNIETKWRNKFTFKPINLTSGILAVVTLVLGLFIGMFIQNLISGTLDPSTTTTNLTETTNGVKMLFQNMI